MIHKYIYGSFRSFPNSYHNMAYSKYQFVLRLLYLKFKEVEHELKRYKIEFPGESVDIYLVQLILLNELIMELNGNQMFILSDENFTSGRLDKRYSAELHNLSPGKLPFSFEEEKQKDEEFVQISFKGSI